MTMTSRPIWVGLCALALQGAAPTVAAPLPATGSTTYAAFLTCRPLTKIDMGEFGNQSIAECVGISSRRVEDRLFDNLAVRCIEEGEARAKSYGFVGWCSQIDGDGDKFYTRYSGMETGTFTYIGGTGKYQNVVIEGQWSVKDSPDLGGGVFGFALDYQVNWRSK